MGTIDRSKFKSTSVSSMVQKDKEVETQLRRDNGYTGYHDIDEGLNTFRAYPAHPDSEGDQFAEPVCVAYLPVMYQEKDKDGNLLTEKGKPKMKEGRKSVFNSRIHGNAKKDLVEEYITFMEKKAKDFFDTESEQKEFMSHILGKYDAKAENRLPSSNYQTTWTLYADKYTGGVPTFGRLSIKKTVKERLNKIASQLDDANNPLITDPFSDVEDGRAFTVFYNKNATKAADYYTTEIDSAQVDTKIGGKTYKVARTYPLSDEQLETFLKAQSLYSTYHNVFKKEDFEFQMEGLKLLDDKLVDKFGLGAFQFDDFLDLAEECSLQFESEETSDDTQEENIGTHEGEEVVEETPEKTDDGINDTYSEMDRSQLKSEIQLNRMGIIIKSTDTDDSLRERIREWKSEQGEKDPEPEVKTENLSAKERIAALKAKAQASK
jgi:hypothetical protein